ncbi:ATP-grasp domain protein [Streptacidiphilus sp. PB12-B1b]|uniref:ATP-grasp domain-containing protein n=1 Tax=Streptacidiphilus sp. PB12-B1b TaxID=2705012 RepID=UPI0015F9440F|nr:ATP-grasp domain-containing protein [Streptacidiphilus sp. PB12-B1b]QMU78700.1 ATP-grasp domain protein [Streptacidiphilus sp. PB12-B1b]
MNDPLRIWLNRTYAENAFFVALLRENADQVDVEVHATHVDPDSPVLRAADVSSLEPDQLSPAAYVEFALDYCTRHRIDLFLPRLHQQAVAAQRAEFAAAGTTVVSPPSSAIELFSDKATAYEALAAAGLPVPPWWRVRDSAALLAAVEEIEADGGTPCLKPVTGAGGEGFRMLSRKPFSLARLAGSPSWSVGLDQVLEALDRAAELTPGVPPVDWLVMPHLAGPEVSVDCLVDPEGRLRGAIGRTKEGRRRGFTLDPAYLAPAAELAEGFCLSYLTNIQFRHHRGVPVLLDINTRPSGGLHQLSRCGVNFPWAAVQLALGREPVGLDSPVLGGDYTLISTPYPALAPIAVPAPAAAAFVQEPEPGHALPIPAPRVPVVDLAPEAPAALA